MGILSKIAPSSASIQKEYVAKRLRALHKNDDAKTERVRKAIVSLLEYNGLRGKEWMDIYFLMHDQLQRRDLTINLEARSWFSKENTRETYGQMYDNSMKNGKMALKSDKHNPAEVRAAVDDIVTLPEEWKHAQPFSQRRRLYKALNASGEKLSNKDAIIKDGYVPPKMTGNGTAGLDTTNSGFKAKAKQIFAGFNYGRRIHGASTQYGSSYLILNPSLKERAIYYPGDTFDIYKHGTASQASYNTIGSLIGYAGGALQQALFDSCVLNIPLEDTKEGVELVEAHIFKKLKLAEDVYELVLSRQSTDATKPYSAEEWRDITYNAAVWCERNHARMRFVP